MSLGSAQLDAFLSVARSRSFSKAAGDLHLTQSALSQRIKQLEEDLGLTLFLRLPGGVQLTEKGERLLRYVQVRDSMEDELLRDLSAAAKAKGRAAGLVGHVRVGAYSSVLRSILMPRMAPLLRAHPGVQIEWICATMTELPGLLQRAECDFVVMDYQLKKPGMASELIGREKYVIIEARDGLVDRDHYLDNDPSDQSTMRFFQFQDDKSYKFTRSYYDDCYGIIDGVEAGLGRAVMCEHLIEDRKKLRVVRGFTPMYVDVVLHYFEQAFYSQLHQAVVKHLANS